MSSCSQCGHRVTQTQTQCSSSKTHRTPTSGCLLTMLALELVPVCSSLRVDTVGDEDDDEDEEDGEDRVKMMVRMMMVMMQEDQACSSLTVDIVGWAVQPGCRASNYDVDVLQQQCRAVDLCRGRVF